MKSGWTLPAFTVFLLIVLNIGGLVSVVLDVGGGHWAGLWKLLAVAALDLLGFGLLRWMRED